MKCFLLFVIILLYMFPLTAFVEQEALFPAKYENGLWGYVNRSGENVIPPQWKQAGEFSDDLAAVSMQEYENWHEAIWEAVIDTAGNYVIAPAPGLVIDEYDTSFRLILTLGDKTEMEGFYDKASGFYQPPVPEYAFVLPWGNGSGPLAIENADGFCGYVNRTNGEIVIPFQFSALYNNCSFQEGYALAANEWKEYDEEGQIIAEGPEFHLIDAAGIETIFPAGISPDGAVSEGILTVSRELTDEEREEHTSGWGTVYGLGTPKGEIIVWPEYDYVWEAGEGCVCFLQVDLCGHMNLAGNVIVPPRYDIETGGGIPYYSFVNGYAVFKDWKNGSGRYVIIDRAGKELFDSSLQDKQITIDVHTFVQANGLLWYRENGKQGLLKVEDGTADFFTDAVFEAYSGYGWEASFCEGLAPVKKDSLWGYIDESAAWAIAPVWDTANDFHNGLARVERDGKMAYIDHSGTIIWQEP